MLLDLRLKKLDQLLDFFLFLLFQTVFTVTANLLPEREPAESTETGKLQVTHGAKTSDTNYLIDSELACTLCVKYCPQKRFEHYMRLLTSTVCFILSHTRISHSKLEPPKPTKWQT